MGLIGRLQSKHNLVLKLTMALFISFLFAWLLPADQVDFHKVDEFDSVWPYNDLVLKKDFLLKKSSTELEEERTQISKESPCIVTIDLSDKDEKLKALSALKDADPKLHGVLAQALDSIYKVGIIESVIETEGKPLLIDNGHLAEVKDKKTFYTLESALQKIQNDIDASSLGNSRTQISPENFLAITHYISKEKTEHYEKEALSSVSIYKEFYPKGIRLVERGEALTKDKRELITEYYNQLRQNTPISSLVFLGRFALIFFVNVILLMYLYFFRKNMFGQNIQVAFLYLSLLTAFVVTWFFYKYGLMLTAIPFVLVPIMVRVFFDSRTALFTHLVCLLQCIYFMPDKFEFLILQLITGIGILFSISEMRKRQQIMNAAIIAVIFYCFLFAMYNLGFGTRILTTKFSAYLPYVISGGLVLLATPLIFITERIFGFVSDFKLLELCDLNQPLLRDLSQQIPGTFQHSLQVANLAEEAIYYIGGNTLLVRAGAMYHDIGKIYNPTYFTENQGNNVSPHMEMMPVESARIIISHVINGIELAKKHKLPEQIIDFIRTHHGTTTVGFFWHMQKKDKAEIGVNEDDFRYPGPIPFSKETAVLMLADGVEAASRSLKKHDALSINDLVDQIIDYKISQNQLINSDITFKDITLIKKIFKKRLMTIYHARIEYPS